MKSYEYEEDLDILYIHNNFNKEKTFSNLVFGNLVVDIGENGKVLGIEIDCASKFFNFTVEELNNLNATEIRVMKMGNFLTLGIVIATFTKEHSFQFAIPQESQSKIPIVNC